MGDHGPFSVSPDHLCVDDCLAAPGFMFSMKNRIEATRNIIITGLSFEHLAPKEYRIVHLFITDGLHSGREEEPTLWREIASTKVPQRNFHYEDIVFDSPI